MEKKDFNLSKVKLLPKGGLTAEYQLTENVGGELSVTDYKATYTRDVHPDMSGAFQDLRIIVARVFGMTSFLSFMASEKLPKDKIENAKKFAEQLMDRIDVRGISLSGSDDDPAVIITSVYEVENGQKSAMNTPRLRMANISFGFEEQLDTIIEQIKEEVFAYLFEGKQAQLSLFGEKEDDPDIDIDPDIDE